MFNRLFGMRWAAPLVVCVALVSGISGVYAQGSPPSPSWIETGSQVVPRVVFLRDLPSIPEQEGLEGFEVERPRLPVSLEEFERIRAQQNVPEAAEFQQFTFADVLAPRRARPSNAQQVRVRGVDRVVSGSRAFSSYPGEPTLAVGPAGIIQTTNCQIRFMDLQGNPISSTKLSNIFFNSTNGVVFDMRAFYDPRRKRYVIVGEDLSNVPGPSPASNLYIAVSRDSTFNSFHVYSFPNTLTYTWGDFPAVGLSDDKLVITERFFDSRTSAGDWTDTPIFVFDRAQLYSGQPSARVQMMVSSAYPNRWFSAHENFGLVPAINLTAGSDIELLSTDLLGHHAVLHVTVSGPPAAPYFSRWFGKAISPYAIPPAAPTGGLVVNEVLDCRIASQIFQVNGVLTATFGTSAVVQGSTVTAVRLLKYRTQDDAVLVDETFGAADRHMLHSAAYTDSLDNTFMGFEAMSPSLGVSNGCAFRSASDVSLTAGPLMTQFTTLGATLNRYGDYSGIAPVEISNDRSTVWYSAQYQGVNSSWSSTISRMILPLCQITGRLVEDCDGDPATTADTRGLANQTIALWKGRYPASPGLVRVTQTNANGQWSFSALPPGDYYTALSNVSGGISDPRKWSTVLMTPGAGATYCAADTNYGVLKFTLAEGDSCSNNVYTASYYTLESSARAPATLDPVHAARVGCNGSDYLYTSSLQSDARASGYIASEIRINGVVQPPPARFVHATNQKVGRVVVKGVPVDGVWSDAGNPSGPWAAAGVPEGPFGITYAPAQGGLYIFRDFVRFAAGLYPQYGGLYSRLYTRNGSSWQSVGSLDVNVRTMAESPTGRVFFSAVSLTDRMTLTTADTRSYSPTANLFWYDRTSATWGSVLGGANAAVHAILPVSSSEVYFAGEFTAVTGPGAATAVANRVARYNGSAWITLGTGINGPVYDMARDGAGRLYVVGAFTQAGTTYSYNVAVWNGTSWEAVGPGIYGLTLRQVVLFKGQPIVASDREVFAWDGRQWRSFASTNGSILDLTVDARSRLFIAGAFSTVIAGSGTTSVVTAASRIAMFDGTDWLPVGTGAYDPVAGSVRSVAVDATTGLLASGEFETLGGSSNANLGLAALDRDVTVGLAAANSSVNYGTSVDLDVVVQSTTVARGRIDLLEGDKVVASALLVGEKASFRLRLTEGPHALRATYRGNGVLKSASSPTVNVVVLPRTSVAGNEAWDTGFRGGRIEYTALCTAPNGTRLAAAMTDTSTTPAFPISLWDGLRWASLGSGANDRVHAVAFAPNGNAYAGGAFTRMGDVSANGIARWNGITWEPLAGGVNGTVRALTFDAAGNLFVAGEFTTADGRAARNIARWNGSRWDSLSSGLPKTVRALLFDAQGRLCAGGDGGGPLGCIAVWNGSVWASLETYWMDPELSVEAMAIDANGSLVAGFNGSNPSLSKWTGFDWLPLSTFQPGLGSVSLSRIRAIAIDLSGRVYAGGVPRYPNIGASTYDMPRVSTVEMWDGSQWSRVSGPNDWRDFCGGSYLCQYAADYTQFVNVLVRDAAGGILEAGHIAGGIHMIGASSPFGFLGVGAGVFNGSPDLTKGSGERLDDGAVIGAMVRDAALGLIVAGPFTNIGSTVARNIARWDGMVWTPMDSMVTSNFYGSPLTRPVMPLLASSEGRVWLGLRETSTLTLPFGGQGNAYSARLWRWNGRAWENRGTLRTENPGLTFYQGAYTPFSLSSMATDSNGDVFVGGQFNRADAVTVRNVARYGAQGWQALGSGVNGAVQALVVDPVAHVVYAAGTFDSAGTTPVRSIARWNGTGWSPMGAGLRGTATALALDPLRRVHVAGSFDSAGSVPSRGLARWDGAQWTSIAGTGLQGTNPIINTMAFSPSGDLYVAGRFTGIDGVAASNLAKWNGTQWSALGSGLDADVMAMAVDSTVALYLGGYFRMAGGALSSGVARLSGITTSVTDVEDGEGRDLPGGVSFGSPTPNPSRGATAIRYQLTRPGRVSLEVIDITGRRVRSIELMRFVPGPGVIEWDGQDASGRRVPSGLYWFRMSAEGVRESRRLILVH